MASYTYNGAPAFNTPHDMRYGYANSKGLGWAKGVAQGFFEGIGPSPMCKFLWPRAWQKKKRDKMKSVSGIQALRNAPVRVSSSQPLWHCSAGG